MAHAKIEVPEGGFDSSTLLGDLRDALLDRLRAMPKPWTVLSEGEQQELIDGCERIALHLITEATRLIAANGFPAIKGTLAKITVKDEMQAQVDLSRHDPQRHEIIDFVNKPVFIVIAEPDMFLGEKGTAKPDAKPEATATSGDENVKPFKGK